MALTIELDIAAKTRKKKWLIC